MYSTLYGAVDFLIVPSKGMYGWGGGSKYVMLLYVLAPSPPPPIQLGGGLLLLVNRQDLKYAFTGGDDFVHGRNIFVK